MRNDKIPATLTLPDGRKKLAGELSDQERFDLMLDRASMDRPTMRLHLHCSLRCPINSALFASRQRALAAA